LNSSIISAACWVDFSESALSTWMATYPC
jgi:hypothetical protein